MRTLFLFYVSRRLTLGFQRDGVPLAESRGSASGRVWDSVPQSVKRSAKGEFQNSPKDCFERGNALQERAFPLVSQYKFA